MQDVAHAEGAGLGQQGEAQVRGRLVVVHLVLGGAEGDEGVVVAAELAHHVPQAEDGAEDELGVVGALIPPRLGGGLLLCARNGEARGACLLLSLLLVGRGGGRGESRGRSGRGGLIPLFRVYALRYEQANSMLASEQTSTLDEASQVLLFHRVCLLRCEVY